MVEADEKKSPRTWSSIDATGKVSCPVTTFCFQKIRGKWRAEYKNYGEGIASFGQAAKNFTTNHLTV